MKYLKKFENHAAYEAAESSLILPNVSLCVNENEVHYNPSTPPTPTAETRVVATFNVENTSEPMPLYYCNEYSEKKGIDLFDKIEIDSTDASISSLDAADGNYTFNTTGEHTVAYTLKDPTSIASSTFAYCWGVASINIPDNVTSIGDGALTDCGGLATCTIGSGVTSIGDSVFFNNASLVSITIEATLPPTLGYDNFMGEMNIPIIYVPYESVDAYKAAEGWSNLDYMIQPIP
jgi:hypothetical protein